MCTGHGNKQLPGPLKTKAVAEQSAHNASNTTEHCLQPAWIGDDGVTSPQEDVPLRDKAMALATNLTTAAAAKDRQTALQASKSASISVPTSTSSVTKVPSDDTQRARITSRMCRHSASLQVWQLHHSKWQ